MDIQNNHKQNREQIIPSGYVLTSWRGSPIIHRRKTVWWGFVSWSIHTEEERNDVKQWEIERVQNAGRKKQEKNKCVISKDIHVGDNHNPHN